LEEEECQWRKAAQGKANGGTASTDRRHSLADTGPLRSQGAALSFMGARKA